jgi:epsilon-lactone hydrolase
VPGIASRGKTEQNSLDVTKQGSLVMPSLEHQKLVAGLEAVAAARTSTASFGTSTAASAEAERGMEPPLPPDVTVEQRLLGGVPCLEVGPPNGPDGRTIVYLHGGGYLHLSARTHVAVAAGLVRATGARCVLVDYRLAPQYPFPAPVQDTVAVYRALLESGTAPGSVAFAGDSAGGGLVLGALVAVRDAGLPLPGAGVAVSPWTDLAITGASVATADDPVVDGPGLRAMAETYLAGASPTEPTASPLYADLRGLPPILIQVGTRESLLDDARRVAVRLGEAGVDVTLREFQDVVHMWVVWDPRLPESLEAFDQAASFFGQHLITS